MFGNSPHNRWGKNDRFPALPPLQPINERAVKSNRILYLLYIILVKSTSNLAGKYLVSHEWGSWAPKAFQGIFKLLIEF